MIGIILHPIKNLKRLIFLALVVAAIFYLDKTGVISVKNLTYQAKDKIVNYVLPKAKQAVKQYL